jgi:hypothetical protein
MWKYIYARAQTRKKKHQCTRIHRYTLTDNAQTYRRSHTVRTYTCTFGSAHTHARAYIFLPYLNLLCTKPIIFTSPTKHIQKTDFTSQKNHRFSQTNHRISHNNSDKTQTKHTHVRVHPQNLHTSKHLRQALLVSCSTHRLENCLHVVCRRAARSTGRRERGAGDSTSQRGESVTKNEHM